MVAALVTLILAQSGPVARVDKLLASSKSFVMDFTLESSRVNGKGTVHAEVMRPNMQLLTVDWGGEEFEFIHSDQGGLSIRHDTKEYFESPTFEMNYAPPSDLTNVGTVAAPLFLYYDSLEKFAETSSFQTGSKETVHGTACDVVRITSMSQYTPGTYTFWIGPDGKILRWKRVFEQNGETTLELTADVQKMEAVTPVASHFAFDIPLGYVPSQAPGPRYWSVAVPGKAPLGAWLNARSNKKSDVAAALAKTPFALVFTDPDSDICAAMEPYLLRLRRQLKQKGCALVEVVLGRAKPNLAKKDKDRTVYWDDDGAIERAYGPAGTPTIFLVDKKGNLVTGWQGYSKEREAQITQTLLDGLKGD